MKHLVLTSTLLILSGCCFRQHHSEGWPPHEVDFAPRRATMDAYATKYSDTKSLNLKELKVAGARCHGEFLFLDLAVRVPRQPGARVALELIANRITEDPARALHVQDRNGQERRLLPPKPWKTPPGMTASYAAHPVAAVVEQDNEQVMIVTTFVLANEPWEPGLIGVYADRQYEFGNLGAYHLVHHGEIEVFQVP